MKDLIIIENQNGVNFVKSLKEIYLGAELSRSHWAKWCKRNVLDNMFFKENVDYQTFTQEVNGNESLDFACTLDMAKHLVLQMPTENAFKYRQYLIDYEKNKLKVPQTYAEALLEAGRLALENEKLQLENKEKSKIIEDNKPKVEFAEKLLESTDNILVREYAKILYEEGIKLGEKKLYKWLRDNKYIMQNKEPYQRYMKYFYVKERTINTPFGTKLRKTTMVSPEGQIYFYHKLKKGVK